MASGAEARAVGDWRPCSHGTRGGNGLWGLLMLGLYRDGRQAEALERIPASERDPGRRARDRSVAGTLETSRTDPASRIPDSNSRGEPLRGYRLLEKVDDGPAGVVFRAIQPHVERDVAVKVFHEGIASDAEFVRRFDPDAQAIAALEHPHIAPIYDYWREPGRAYIVSRYLRGGSLRAIEERGEPLERERALRVIEQVSLALAFAHGQGMAHGNVGSSNILFDPEGNAYLGDFLIRGGPAPDPSEDVQELARFARRLLPNETSSRGTRPPRLLLGTSASGAAAFAVAARAALEPMATGSASRRAEERNPYKGLRAFTEADAYDFFGRGALTRRLVARLSESGPGSRFLAVVGPSGGGKSSVVRAGLVPAIRQRRAGGSRRIASSPRWSPEHTQSTSSRPRSFGSPCDPCLACTTGSMLDRAACSRRSIWLRPRGGARARGRSVRGGLHTHRRGTGTGTVPRGAARGDRRSREPAPCRS